MSMKLNTNSVYNYALYINNKLNPNVMAISLSPTLVVNSS